MRELFVYYRVRAGKETSARHAVSALQMRLRRQFPQLNTRLLCRSEAFGGVQTWMETYAMDARPDGAGITVEIEQEIEAQARALAQYIAGARHTEVFVPCVASP